MDQAVQIRRAALMHDLGLVAVPSYTLEKPQSLLSEAEWEDYRLHPYHGERILRRVPTLAHLAEMVGHHQEQMDGSGYYRGISAANVSLGARIIGVADRLDELTHSDSNHVAMPVKAAIVQLGAEPHDQEIVGVLQRLFGEAAVASPRVSKQNPAGLTDREVEVLVLAARGLTRDAIARSLSISENTVRHHLGHIYTKTGTSNRVTATLFAMENGLLQD